MITVVFVDGRTETDADIQAPPTHSIPGNPPSSDHCRKYFLVMIITAGVVGIITYTALQQSTAHRPETEKPSWESPA